MKPWRNCRGTFAYDWDLGHYDPDSINSGRKPLALKWLADRLGADHFANVIEVNLFPSRSPNTLTADDDTLRRVSGLSHLEVLKLYGVAVTDAGLAHVKHLRHLRALDLTETQISDAGLANLRGMTGLRQLIVAGTHVTDVGVLTLEESLPDLQILREDDMLVMRFVTRVAGDLEFARSQPVRQASALLLHRARLLVANPDSAQLTATVDALCSLQANDVYSLLKLAEAEAACLETLRTQRPPSLTATEREALERQCADRALDALSLAVDQGYNNLQRLEGGQRATRSFGNLHDQPRFAELVARVKARRAAR